MNTLSLVSMVALIVFSLGLLYGSYEKHTGSKGLNVYQWVALMIKRGVIAMVLIVLTLNVLDVLTVCVDF